MVQGTSAASIPLWASPAVRSLDEAVFYTLAYADVFAYPLTFDELHRYLIGISVVPAALVAALRQRPAYAAGNGYFTLPERSSLAELRPQRARAASAMWPRALVYGRAIARLPFVRMVALTGALSMGNVEPDDDFDYLVVTAPDRVWLTRLLIIQLVVRPAARRGDEVCPNYLLSEHALALRERTLYHAHELAQMIPLYGMDVYKRLRAANRWADGFLPNAAGPPDARSVRVDSERMRRNLLENALRSPLGSWLDRLELSRMRRKLTARVGLAPAGMEELSLAPERCKGHTSPHAQLTLEAFAARVDYD